MRGLFSATPASTGAPDMQRLLVESPAGRVEGEERRSDARRPCQLPRHPVTYSLCIVQADEIEYGDCCGAGGCGDEGCEAGGAAIEACAVKVKLKLELAGNERAELESYGLWCWEPRHQGFRVQLT